MTVTLIKVKRSDSCRVGISTVDFISNICFKICSHGPEKPHWDWSLKIFKLNEHMLYVPPGSLSERKNEKKNRVLSRSTVIYLRLLTECSFG